MTRNELFKATYEKALALGMRPKNPHKEWDKKEYDRYLNAVVRSYEANKSSKSNSTSADGDKAAEKKAEFFSFIQPSQATSGMYSDFSFVVFPENADDIRHCIVGLCVGSNGFLNDFELASLPWYPREFNRLNNLNSKGYKYFSKSNFNDTTTEIPGLFDKSDDEVDGFSAADEFSAVKAKYGQYLMAAALVELQDDDKNPLDPIFIWLALYAHLNGWGNNKAEKAKQLTLLDKIQDEEKKSDYDKIEDLINRHRFIVVQGAPGVGKTYNALQIADRKYKKENVFFRQFHAETSYSDFVWGITPKLKATEGEAQFEAAPGVLYQAIKCAQELKETGSKDRVLLIIDEINRANLSNVLGPVFYLFEKHRKGSEVEIPIGDMKITELPDNIDVIATMNTADRSLAVVDFALRRRFTWYTIKPKGLETTDSDTTFRNDEFNQMARIFRKYATDTELNLQPGPSYFLVNTKNSSGEDIGDIVMEERLEYELLPLIKEYLLEGFMPKARDSFNQYFLKFIHKPIFE